MSTLDVGPYPGGDQYYRYRDMLNHPYTRNPGNGSYNGWYDPSGLVTYQLSDGATLIGTITATGLKPHFAYQVKLEGMLTARYPWSPADLADPLNWSNKQIGSVGRWWCDDCGWNVSDAELASGAHNGHMVRGYLLFDFFMTDINGYATQDLHLDSSLHVLWRTDMRRPNPRMDGKPRSHLVTYSSDAYSSQFSNQTVQVYAEGETGRPRPGQVVLPVGQYQCRLLITEESFHNVPPDLASQFPWGYTNYADGGFWAHALSDDAFSFTIGGSQPGGVMHVASIDMALQSKGAQVNAIATVTVVDTAGKAVSGTVVSATWSGVVSGTASGTTDGTGKVQLTSPKTRASSGAFTFAVTDVTKTGWTYDSSGNVETSDSISL